ncbi:uncharacterized protein PHA67_016083 isoform 2-T2 [Liasis olivaceus]
MYPSATGPRLLEPSSGRGASEAKRAECQLGPRSLGQTVLWPPSRRPTCFPFHELPGLLWELCSLSVQRMPGLWSLLLTVGLLEGLRGAQSCVPPPGARNWARGRPAAQSSTYPQWGDVYSLAGSAVDGNRDGDWRHGSCSHTTAEEEPWWSLDLGAPYAIAAVVVKNRQECCSERIEGAQIRVGDCGAQHGKHNPISNLCSLNHQYSVPTRAQLICRVGFLAKAFERSWQP